MQGTENPLEIPKCKLLQRPATTDRTLGAGAGVNDSSPLVCSLIGLGSGTLEIEATPGSRCRRIAAPKGASSSPVGHPPVNSLLVSVGLAQLEIPTTRCGALLMQPVARHECSRSAVCVLSANF